MRLFDRITRNPLNMRDVSWITANLREADARELFCQRRYTDAFTLTHEVVYFWGDCSSVVQLDGQPVAAIGVTEMQPGVWSAWAFGTRDMARTVPFLSRHMMGDLIPRAISCGAQRVEARSIADHHAAHRWMKHLGAQGPVVLDEWGQNGETFHLFWWTLTGYNRGNYPYVRSSSSPT